MLCNRATSQGGFILHAGVPNTQAFLLQRNYLETDQRVMYTINENSRYAANTISHAPGPILHHILHLHA